MNDHESWASGHRWFMMVNDGDHCSVRKKLMITTVIRLIMLSGFIVNWKSYHWTSYEPSLSMKHLILTSISHHIVLDFNWTNGHSNHQPPQGWSKPWIPRVPPLAPLATAPPPGPPGPWTPTLPANSEESSRRRRRTEFGPHFRLQRGPHRVEATPSGTEPLVAPWTQPGTRPPSHSPGHWALAIRAPWALTFHHR